MEKSVGLVKSIWPYFVQGSTISGIVLIASTNYFNGERIDSLKRDIEFFGKKIEADIDSLKRDIEFYGKKTDADIDSLKRDIAFVGKKIDATNNDVGIIRTDVIRLENLLLQSKVNPKKLET